MMSVRQRRGRRQWRPQHLAVITNRTCDYDKGNSVWKMWKKSRSRSHMQGESFWSPALLSTVAEHLPNERTSADRLGHHDGAYVRPNILSAEKGTDPTLPTLTYAS